MMKNKFMQIALGTIFGLSLLIGSAQFCLSGQELKNESLKDSTEKLSSSSPIVGTWQTSVTPRNCQTGDPVAPPFPGLLTFNQGETLVGTAPAVGTVGGVWRRGQGFHDYSFAFIFLRYSPTGTFIGTQKVRQTVTLLAGSNDFTSTGTTEILDVNGNVIGNGCSTSTGTRFE